MYGHFQIKKPTDKQRFQEAYGYEFSNLRKRNAIMAKRQRIDSYTISSRR